MAKQITQEQVDKIVERLIDRVEKANSVFLKKIGKSIDEISKLTPSNAHTLAQILKYGGDYEKMLKEIDKYTKLNIQDINKIFSEYAKRDQEFYKQFYQYRDKPFVKYEDNQLIKNQTQALANVVKNEMFNYTRDNILGYSLSDEMGRVKFTGMRETYNKVLDLAVMNISQGKETFGQSMSGILKEIGGSGLKTINYESGRSVRLDSTVRMHLKSRLLELHNENQKIYGSEFGADGVEISVHGNPAIDHEEVQGRQFSKAEFDRLMSGLDAKDYKGNTYTLDHDGNGSYRPISELNCYHYQFDIILGVNEPEYTDEQLQKIKESNDKGFDFEGKHYTNYEGTQLQRAIERKIREQKDIHILAKESGNKDLLNDSQSKIDQLTDKYRELSKESGLPTKMERLSVSGYRRTKVNKSTPPIRKLKETEYLITAKDQEELADYYINAWEPHKNESFYKERTAEKLEQLIKQKEKGFKDEIIDLSTPEGCEKLLSKINGKVFIENTKSIDKRLLANTTKNVYEITRKSPILMDDTKINTIQLNAEDLSTSTMAQYMMNRITLNKHYYNNYDILYEETKSGVSNFWFSDTAEDKMIDHIITHETGHHLYSELATKIKFSQDEKYISFMGDIKSDEYGYIPISAVKKKIIDIPIKRVMEKENLSRAEVISKYVSRYGKSNFEEMFAETFANSQLGKSNVLGDELIKLLKELGAWE